MKKLKFIKLFENFEVVDFVKYIAPETDERTFSTIKRYFNKLLRNSESDTKFKDFEMYVDRNVTLGGLEGFDENIERLPGKIDPNSGNHFDAMGDRFLDLFSKIRFFGCGDTLYLHLPYLNTTLKNSENFLKGNKIDLVQLAENPSSLLERFNKQFGTSYSKFKLLNVPTYGKFSVGYDVFIEN